VKVVLLLINLSLFNMSKTKILVFGYFGFEHNELCGQTIKTRNVYSLLKDNVSEDLVALSYVDSQTFKNNKIKFLNALRDFSKADVVYYLPASKNLTYIFPILFLVSKLFRVQLHYIVIGGWLGEFLKSKVLHKWMLVRINKIYVETKALKELLASTYSFKNVALLHNFRNVKYKALIKNDTGIGLVFMARINPKKGIELLFKLSEKLKKNKLSSISIDMYGPIVSDYENEFNKKLLNSNDNLNYKGILDPSDIYATLNKYDLMLFPTKYYTEGLPGSIIDGYIAGLPVIASKWLYASEIIEDNVSGIVTDFDNEEAFIEKVLEIVENPLLLNKLKEGALKKKNEFSADKAWEIVKGNLDVALEK
tara:strand:- start:266 stop:1360 length:1095 start_codon:yes stop_codon:yes gene_type:complete